MNAPQVLERVPGLTYRQLDTWCSKGYLGPNMIESGSGNHRQFSAYHISLLQQVVRLLGAGLTLAKAWEITLDDAHWQQVAGHDQIQLGEGVWLWIR